MGGVLWTLVRTRRAPKSRLSTRERSTDFNDLTHTYDDLAETFVRSILNTFPLRKAGVYFYDVSRREFVLRGQEGMQSALLKDLRSNRAVLSIPETDWLIRRIGQASTLISKKSLATGDNADEADKSVLQTLDRMEAEVVAPFLLGGKVMGLVAFGANQDGSTPEESSAFYAFARLGEEVMRYILGMEKELIHTADYSHDMNNDTKSLVQTLQYLQSPLASKQPREKINLLLHQAEDVAMRLNQTFELNTDRSELIMKSIRGEYQRGPVDISRAVRMSCAKYISIAEKKNIALKTRIPSERSIVEGNASDLTRVVDNLINNSMRYIKSGGEIELTCQEVQGQYEIFLKDNGRGMELGDIKRIWEQGWQVSDARQGASGLGLSIARQIVHLHGGSISVESVGQGQGTIFVVKIPLLDSVREAG
jgi:signal transduction histidine kinase